ncbi:zinc finger protein 518B [Brachionichthys hirsutus]|uniref:zinc finger protein 518B n=1 Tax=Brachionichthys hirsutus TaxID=412623 RepID=UPI003604A5E3
MKPVSYRGVPPPPVNGGRPVLDRAPGALSLMRCEKCGYASTDAAAFKKHALEHAGTRFFCFYCNDISSSEAELNAHLKQHTAKYPFKCPHCGQGYMRRLCLVKHIDRVHYGPAKAGDPNVPRVPVSGASPSVPAADLTALRPLVRVSVPASTAPAFRLAKDEQRAKPPDANAGKVNGELQSPLNGLIQHNRALTVSLPDEVSIPAGCLVELVEVKTVNGTKELKLRLVSQQENGSVVKDTRTAAHQNVAAGKQLSSALINPRTAKTPAMGPCTVNRTQAEPRTVNAERPAAAPVSVSKNLLRKVGRDKSLLKRPSQEIINLECHTFVPNKVPKVLNLVREKTNGIRVPQREPAASASLAAVRVPAKPSTGALRPENVVTQRATHERKNSTADPPKRIQRSLSGVKSVPRDACVAVKQEPGEILVESGAASSTAAGLVRTPSIPLCKDNVAKNSYSAPRTLNGPSFTTPALSNRTNPKVSVWNQEVGSADGAGEGRAPEPEGFPVISSVFSLSQQPEDAPGPIQPLVMALRGIVMDNKSNSPVNTSQDQITMKSSAELTKETQTSGHGAMLAPKDEAFAPNLSLTAQKSEPVKVEDCFTGAQLPPAPTHGSTHVKEEQNDASVKDEKECSGIADSISAKEEEPVSETDGRVAASTASEDPPQPTERSENDVSSKFLTVSLKRVQVGVWKKNKKGVKLRISKYKSQVSVGSLSERAAIYPMPLKEDQPVKRPGPNQPVVVLNHPKPRLPVQGTRTDTSPDTAAPQAVPKCQILKMRLSKVMGQKYEVMGCTVGVFP